MIKLNRIMRRYKEDQDGNVTVMFVMSFLATFTMIGAALDIVLLSKTQAKMQHLSDAAALAALQYEGSIEDKQAAFDDYIQSFSDLSGLKDQPVTKEITMGVSDAAYTLNAVVEVPYQLSVLNNVKGFDTVSVNTSVSLGIEDVEIALVLDVSSSMNGTRLAEAQSSAKFFIEQLLGDEQLEDRVSISLVPFGGTVRLPKEMITLMDRSSYGTIEDNSVDIDEDGNPIATDDDGFNGYTRNWIDGEWNGCFELDATDTQNGISPDGLYRVTPDYYSWWEDNPWCPLSGNELVPLTDDADLLNDRIDTLSRSDGTGSDHGFAWGFETLNNDWKNLFPGGRKNTPAANKSSTKKVIVFMSDGGITSQHYVQDNLMTGDLPYNSKRKVRETYNNSLAAFYGACDRAKEQEIEVYTIGYLLRKTSQKTQLETCATSESHYIDASTGDLEDVFNGIASSISPLRISN